MKYAVIFETVISETVVSEAKIIKSSWKPNCSACVFGRLFCVFIYCISETAVSETVVSEFGFYSIMMREKNISMFQTNHRNVSSEPSQCIARFILML